MSRLQIVFEKLKKENKKAKGIFLMSGFPDRKTFEELFDTCLQAGVDFIELGMPFSDPSADAPIVQKSGTIALQNGTTVAQTISSIKEFRQKNDNIPVVWVGYFNSIYNYGIDKFIREFNNAGGDGLLIYDLPPEESYHVECIKDTEIDLIRIISQDTDAERYKTILDGCSGFLYFVSVKGFNPQSSLIINKIKNATSLPLIVGENMQQLGQIADGIIWDVSVVEKVMQKSKEGLKEFLEK